MVDRINIITIIIYKTNTLGPINQTGVEILAELGHRLEVSHASDLFFSNACRSQCSASKCSHSEAALLTNDT